MKKLFRRIEKSISSLFASRKVAKQLAYDAEFAKQEYMRARRSQHPNPFVRHGKKCFSQGDEDGLTLAIIDRIGLDDGIYCEYGVGDGTENNTLIIGALGWRGFWVGGEPLAFDQTETASRFQFFQQWVTSANIVSLHQRGLEAISAEEVDVLSLDLDGNDIHLARTLLQAGVKPKLLIVEYNGKFPPPVRFEIAYDADHHWSAGDYYGASLQSYADLLEENGYFCVCCNAGTGVNAFFVHSRYRDRFPEVPSELSDIYAEPSFGYPETVGHPTDLRTVMRILSK